MKAKVLVVDDKDKYLEDAIESLKECEEIEPIVASGFREAVKLMREHFIVAAFVDLVIARPGDPGNGDTLLNHLFLLRPTARRVLCTQQAAMEISRITKALHPAHGVAECVWRRGDGRFGDIIQEYVSREGLFSDMVVESLDEILASVRPKVEEYQRKCEDAILKTEPAVVTKEEIHHVLSRLLRPHQKLQADRGGVTHASVDDRISRIKLVELNRGKSLSCVFKGNPITRNGDPGILCIIKLGPRRDMEDEVRAYERNVRFTRHTYRRVEMLSSCFADTIGGACYSFAGRSPRGEDVMSLQDIIEDNNMPFAISVLRTEMNPAEKEWYKKESEIAAPLSSFFGLAYGLKLPDHVDSVLSIAQSFMAQAARVGGICLDGRLARKWYFDDSHGRTTDVLLPEEEDIGDLNIEFKRYRSAIVHGDLNGENLLVGKPVSELFADNWANPIEWVIPIDYRHTQRGPIFVDCAALEAAVRCSRRYLVAIETPADYRRMIQLVEDEKKLLREAWLTVVPYEVGRLGEFRSTGVSWADLSFEITQLARGNFSKPGLGTFSVKREYVATCLLYALRLLKIQRLYEPNVLASKARLMVWMSALLSCLRNEK